MCAPLVEALDAIPYSNPDAQAQRFAEEEQTCPREIGTRLTQNTGTLFIVDATGPHWLSTDEALAALGRVDTRAKALLAAYLYGYDLTWFDGDHSYGAPEDGHVRKVGGGFEVVVGREVFQRLSCVSGTSEVTHSYYRLVLFVDVRGRISEREKVATQSHVSYERCYGY